MPSSSRSPTSSGTSRAMVDQELAQRVVERHVLRSDRRVESVHEEPAGIVVETDTLPWVVRAPSPPFDGIDVVEIVRGYHVDPAPAAIGIAVAGDGGSFRLNDPEEFGASWAALGGSVGAAVLADLMAAYLSGDYRGMVAGSGRQPTQPGRSEQLASVVGCGPLEADETD